MAARNNPGIGSTDISAILGLHPNRTAYDVWCDKHGLLDAVVEETNNRMRAGKRLEKVIAEWYGDETGQEVTWLDQTVQHPTRQWQTGTPDAIVRKASTGVDAKNVAVDQSRKWGQPGTAEVPDHIQIQCHWFLSLFDWARWDVALLLGGCDFRIYHIDRDEDLEATLLEAAERFWTDHILNKTPPPIDGSASARRYLLQRFPKQEDVLRPATDEEIELVYRIRDLKKQESALCNECSALENRLKELIGNSEGILVDRSKITWKWQKGSTYTVSREPTRVLRGFDHLGIAEGGREAA